MAAIVAAVRVTEAFARESDGYAEIEADDWERLRRATEEPSPPGYHPAAARSCLEFMWAILNARALA
jgi:hypothetical protein